MRQPLKRNRARLIIRLVLILLCFILPGQILYWTLCTKQDRNIPPNTEVLVSACKRPTVIGVPGGEVLFVHEGLTDKMYLLDLRTGEKRKVPKDPLLYNEEMVVFLSPKLVWLIGSARESRPNYILDLSDGQRYELLDLTLLPLLKDGTFNPDNYSYIQSADHIFIDISKDRLIALTTDFRTNQNGRVTLAGYIGHEDQFLLNLVKNLEMDYENVDLTLSSSFSNTPSPTGKYVARDDEIYLSKTNTKLAYSYYFKSWYYDESGMVVHDEYGTYWLQPRFFGDYGWNFYHLSFPVLKLNLAVP